MGELFFFQANRSGILCRGFRGDRFSFDCNRFFTDKTSDFSVKSGNDVGSLLSQAVDHWPEGKCISTAY